MVRNLISVDFGCYEGASMFLRTSFICVALTVLTGTQVHAQRGTTFTTVGGSWFDQTTWSGGVPTADVVTTIPDGILTVAAGGIFQQQSPTSGPLTIGLSLPKESNSAELIVNDTNLVTEGQLTVGISDGGTTFGTLNATSKSIREGGSVSASAFLIGHAAKGSGKATGVLNVSGNLQSTGRLPTLSVGLNSSDGFASGDVTVGSAIGDQTHGFQSVQVGFVEKQATGDAVGTLDVGSLCGNGKSDLQVGVSLGAGSATGGLTVQDEASGFNEVVVGSASSNGTASGQLDVFGPLSAVSLTLGSETQTGMGNAVFHAGAKFSGQQITVHPGSSLETAADLGSSVFNFGQFNLNGLESEQRFGVTFIDGDFVQTSTGVTSFDVTGPKHGSQYESLRVSDKADLSGLVEVNFSPDYKPVLGDSITLLEASAVDTDNLNFYIPNVPDDLAIATSTKGGLTLEFVEPRATDFLNPEGDSIQWDSPTLWKGGSAPNLSDEVSLMNNHSTPQNIVAPNATVRSMSIGGVQQPMTVTVPEEGTFSVSHQLAVERRGSLELKNGRLLASSVNVSRGALFEADGHMTGNLINNGSLQIGALSRAEILTIDGDLELGADGVFELDILGGEDGEFDQLIVNGSAILNGTLLINIPPGAAEPGLEIPILRVDDDLDVNLNVLFTDGSDFGDLMFGLRDNGDGQVVLYSISGGLRGDMNQRGSVNECDFDDFVTGLRDPRSYIADFEIPPLFLGDMNFDAQLDVDDIDIFFESIHGVECGPEDDDIMEIPEPSTNSIALTGLLLLFLYSRKFRKES